jgi:hypothetical protein
VCGDGRSGRGVEGSRRARTCVSQETAILVSPSLTYFAPKSARSHSPTNGSPPARSGRVPSAPTATGYWRMYNNRVIFAMGVGESTGTCRALVRRREARWRRCAWVRRLVVGMATRRWWAVTIFGVCARLLTQASRWENPFKVYVGGYR